MSERGAGADAGTWSYRPGSWFAVFGPGATLLLPPEQKDRVVELWARIDDGAEFGDVLDGLLASGLSRIPAFALLSTPASAEDTTRVLVRGDGVRAVVTGADGEVEVDGSGATTWSERSVAGVTACRVELETAASDDDAVDAGAAVLPDHTIETGLVRVSRVDRPAVAPAAAEPAPAEPDALDEPAAAEPGPLDEPLPVAVPVAVPVDEPVEEPAEEPAEPDLGPPTEHMPLGALDALDAAAEESPADDAPPSIAIPASDETEVSDDETEDEPESATDEAFAPVPAGADPLNDPLTDPLPESHEQPEADDAAGDGWPAEEDEAAAPAPAVDDDGWMSPPTGDPSPSATPPPPLPVGSWGSPPDAPSPRPDLPPPPAPPASSSDHDGLTRTGAVDPDEFARQRPGIPGQPPAPAVTRAVAKLLISNGEVVEVDRVVLIGRAPEARRFTSTEQPMLVTVPSPLHEISSTHVEVRPGSGADHGSAVVTDMGSTNGTVLAQPGLPPEDLKPGIAVQLIPGAIINLGDGVTIQVSRP